MSVMAERETVIDFTVPYYDLVGITIMMQLPSTPSSLFKFLTVLETDVWLCILGAYFFTRWNIALCQNHEVISSSSIFLFFFQSQFFDVCVRPLVSVQLSEQSRKIRRWWRKTWIQHERMLVVLHDLAYTTGKSRLFQSQFNKFKTHLKNKSFNQGGGEAPKSK